ncbi:sensor histidine kinase [Pseudonocardia spirodelae]|uniref:histidine kinase n=1 Tax=Pseudonocardia spirodelae TaxID=3133431 RepID=A0ABU8T2M1_9PSEU
MTAPTPWPRAATLLLAAVTGVLAVAGPLLAARAGTGLAEPLLWSGLSVLPLAPALLLAARRPQLAVAPLLAAAGAGAALNGAGDRYLDLVAAGASPPGAWWVVPLVLQMSWMLFFVPFALLALVFPDGRPPRGWGRAVAAGLPAVPVLAAVAVAVAPGGYRDPAAGFPHTLGTGPDALTGVAVVLVGLFWVLLLAAGTAPVLRRRRTTDPVERAQLRWLGLAGLGIPVTLLLCWASYLLLDGPDLVVAGLVGLYVGIPAATVVAVLRHGLYDVDRAYAATLTWTAVAAALLAVHSTVAFAVGSLAGQGSAPTAAAATAVCAAALAPLRVRLRRVVDARIDPHRRAALDAVAALTRESRDGRARPEELAGRLRAALGDPTLVVGHRPPGGDADTLVDAEGRPLVPDGGRVVPVVRDGRRVGVVAAAGVSRSLLREVAEGAALLVEVVCLRQEASRAQAEAEAGRARLLEVGDAERRRLERDLHDGAQQRLVSLGMTLRLAQRRLDTDPVSALDAVLDEAVAELAAAVAELRRIAHGLRPSGLDDGLPAALRGLTARLPLPVRLEIVDEQPPAPALRPVAPVPSPRDGAAAAARPAAATVPAAAVPATAGPAARGPAGAPGTAERADPDWLDVPDPVALTAYYVVGEALTNTVRHAGATRVEVRATRCAAGLRVRVRDDGSGGAAVRPGHGLGGLADRVAAAGGTLAVRSDDDGTEVTAELPCGS